MRLLRGVWTRRRRVPAPSRGVSMAAGMLRIVARGVLAAAATVAGGTVAALVVLAPQAAGEVVRLAGGGVLLVELRAVDPDGITALRADTGGEVRLPWDRLAPGEEERLKRKAGLILTPATEETTRADRIVLVDGEELVGRVEAEGDPLRVKTLEGMRTIPAARVQNREAVTVSVLDIDTRQELIARKRAELPADTPEGHFRLALYCLSLHAYPEAKEHLEALRQLDPTYEAAVVAKHLETAGEEIQHAEEAVFLRRIGHERLRGRAEQALALCEEFRRTYPDSPLLDDVAALQADLEADRTGRVARAIVADFFSFLDKAVKNHGRDRELELSEARSWVTQELEDDVLQTIAERHGISATEARELFARRKMSTTKRANYGTGTFLLGDGARKGLPVARRAARAEGGGRSNPRGRQGRNSRYGRTRRAKEPPSPEGWWAGASGNERAQWMLATFVEGTDLLEVVRIDARTCGTCGGDGSIESLGSGGSTQTVCPRCSGPGFDRIVVFR